MVAGEVLARDGHLVSERWAALAEESRRVGLDLIAGREQRPT
jgi:hypothetical protein